MPARSDGVLVAPHESGAVAYDPVTEQVHHLNRTAAAIFCRCSGDTARIDAVRDWAEQTGEAPELIAADLATALKRLDELGLVGRSSGFSPPASPLGSRLQPVSGSLLGAVHRVIDWAIRFRSSDSALLTAIDDHLGTGHEAAPPGTLSLVIDIQAEPNGRIALIADFEMRFPSLDSLLQHLPTVLAEYAAWTSTCAVLHAGAVRNDRGEIVLITGPSGSGKSTLTAAMVSLGWDYLGDDIVGVRAGAIAVAHPKRVALDSTSRAVLSIPETDLADIDPAVIRTDVRRVLGDGGPIGRVVLPDFEEGAVLNVEDLAPSSAINAVLRNSLNLGRAGQDALEALTALATDVPVQRLRFGDAVAAAHRVSALHLGRTLSETF
jgi:hypothetical protein